MPASTSSGRCRTTPRSPTPCVPDELDKARDLLARWRGEPAVEWTESEIARACDRDRLRARTPRPAGRDRVVRGAAGPGRRGSVQAVRAFCADKWGRRTDEEFGAFGRFSAKVFHVLDWVPLRLTAIGFAIAGDFEDAVACWRATGANLARSRDRRDSSERCGRARTCASVEPLPKEGGVNYRAGTRHRRRSGRQLHAERRRPDLAHARDLDDRAAAAHARAVGRRLIRV